VKNCKNCTYSDWTGVAFGKAFVSEHSGRCTAPVIKPVLPSCVEFVRHSIRPYWGENCPLFLAVGQEEKDRINLNINI
jgi:hypothetical protein